MVRMKHIFGILFALLLLMPVCSCEDNNQNLDYISNAVYNEKLDSLTQAQIQILQRLNVLDKQIKKIDSVNVTSKDSIKLQRLNELEKQIKKIDSANVALNDSVKVLSSKIEPFKKSSNLRYAGVIVAFIVSFIAFVVFVLILLKRRTGIDKKRLVKMIFDESKFQTLHSDVEHLKLQQSQGSEPLKRVNSEFEFLKERVSSLETQTNVPCNQNNPTSSYARATPQNRYEKAQEKHPTPILKSYYVNGNGFSGSYFVTTTETKQEDSIIKINECSEGKGEFTIISIDQIRQLNGLNEIIAHEPLDISLQNAKTFKVIHNGKCEKANDGTWRVKDRVKIKINK